LLFPELWASMHVTTIGPVYIPRSQRLPAAPSWQRHRAPERSSSTHAPRPSTHLISSHDLRSTDGVGLQASMTLSDTASSASSAAEGLGLDLDEPLPGRAGLTPPPYLLQPVLLPFVGRRLPPPLVVVHGGTPEWDVRAPVSRTEPVCLCLWRCLCRGRFILTVALLLFFFFSSVSLTSTSSSTCSSSSSLSSALSW